MSNPNKNAVDLTDLIKDKFTMRKDIAPVETSATASRAYKVGDKFYYGNLLQEATQDIAQGGTLTLNTNYKNADPVTTSIQNLTNYVIEKGVKNIVPPFSEKYTDETTNQNCTLTENSGVYSFTSTGNYGRKTMYFPKLLKVGKKYRFVFKKKCTVSNNIACSIALRGVNGTYETQGNIYYTEASASDNDFVQISQRFTAEYEDLYVMFYVQRGSGSGNKIEIKDFMIFDESITNDPTYEPYAKTNQQLTRDKVGMDLLSEVGAVNHLNNTAVTAVENGITWTVYDDKSMNANGTQNAPGNSVFELGYQSLKKGTYRLTGCPEDGGYNTSIQLYLPNDQYAVDYGDGAVFTLNEDATCRCNVWVKNHASFSNKVFKPMISPVDYNGPYVPYAKSNKELTEDVEELAEVAANIYAGKPRTKLMNIGNKTTLTITVPLSSAGSYTQGFVKLCGFNNNTLIDCSLGFALNQTNTSVAGSKLSNYSSSAVTLDSITVDNGNVVIVLSSITTYVQLIAIYGMTLRVNIKEIPEWTFK